MGAGGLAPDALSVDEAVSEQAVENKRGPQDACRNVPLHVGNGISFGLSAFGGLDSEPQGAAFEAAFRSSNYRPGFETQGRFSLNRP